MKMGFKAFRKTGLALLTAVATTALTAGTGHAADTIRIGLSTKAWFPSFVAEITQQQGIFTKHDIKAELTVYQSGSEALTAIAAGAADLMSSNPSIVGEGREAGVNVKMVAMLATRNFGWQIMVPPKSGIKTVADLAKHKVGITSAGSNTDLLASWVKKKYGIDFIAIPVGGAGLVPNLISGNLDAVIIYPPLSYQVALDGNGRVLTDFSDVMPPHLEAGWAADDEYAAKHKDALKRALTALFEGVAYIKGNPDAVIPQLAKYDGISVEVAKQEYTNTFGHLSDDGAMTRELVQETLNLYPNGKKELDAAVLFDSSFTPVAIPR